MNKIIAFALAGLFFASAINAKENIKIVNRNESSAKINVSADKKTKLAVILKTGECKFDVKSIATENIKHSEEIKIKGAKKIADSAYILFVDSGKENYNFTINELSTAKKYSISAYSLENLESPTEKDFYTLSPEPQKQASISGFLDVDDSKISTLLKKGDGKGRIVVATKGDKITLPSDGIEYIPDPSFGKGSEIGGGSFVIFDAKHKELKCSATDLKPGKYKFQVFEYNGAGETRNYLTSETNNNPRYKATVISAPQVSEAENITETSFVATWKKVDGALSYELDVAKDPNFNSFVELYEKSDVGDLDKMDVVDLKPGTYYYRVRAISEDSRSANSKVIKVEIK